jgi:hypothetical protein
MIAIKRNATRCFIISKPLERRGDRGAGAGKGDVKNFLSKKPKKSAGMQAA